MHVSSYAKCSVRNMEHTVSNFHLLCIYYLQWILRLCLCALSYFNTKGPEKVLFSFSLAFFFLSSFLFIFLSFFISFFISFFLFIITIIITFIIYYYYYSNKQAITQQAKDIGPTWATNGYLCGSYMGNP